jgi:hypothetical protein
VLNVWMWKHEHEKMNKSFLPSWTSSHDYRHDGIWSAWNPFHIFTIRKQQQKLLRCVNFFPPSRFYCAAC